MFRWVYNSRYFFQKLSVIPNDTIILLLVQVTRWNLNCSFSKKFHTLIDHLSLYYLNRSDRQVFSPDETIKWFQLSEHSIRLMKTGENF